VIGRVTVLCSAFRNVGRTWSRSVPTRRDERACDARPPSIPDLTAYRPPPIIKVAAENPSRKSMIRPDLRRPRQKRSRNEAPACNSYAPDGARSRMALEKSYQRPLTQIIPSAYGGARTRSACEHRMPRICSISSSSFRSPWNSQSVEFGPNRTRAEIEHLSGGTLRRWSPQTRPSPSRAGASSGIDFSSNDYLGLSRHPRARA